MILFQNSLIKLVYDPATDILSVDMPHVSYNLASEFKRALDIIVENVRNYDVKKLLVDARKSVIEMEPEEYEVLVKKFSSDLSSTRLQKGARVVSDNGARENVVHAIVRNSQPELVYETFSDIEEAIKWLKEDS